MGVLLGMLANSKKFVLNICHMRKGSITLEAALAVPLLLTFVLAFIAFVELAQSEAGLRSAVYQATEQLAIQAYPLEMLGNTLEKQEMMQKLNDWNNRYKDGKSRTEEWLEEYGPLMPEVVRNGVSVALQTADQMEEQMTEPVRQAFHPLVARYLPEHMDANRLKITKLQYPILFTEHIHDVSLEASYEVPIHIPFLTRTITLHATARERMWIGQR